MRQTDSVNPDEEVQDRRPATKEFRPDIEGLRAVAVLAVVLFHADMPGVGGGFVGVDVFFVISGFLITGLLWREVSSTGTIRLRNFYGARARRLLPASATVGVAIMVGAAALLPVLRTRSVIWDGIASALYVSNYRFALQGVDYLGATAAPSPFQHYWSLGVEEQFYLVWPPLIIGTAWLIRRMRGRTKADAFSSKTPYLWVLGLVAVCVFRAIPGDHLRATSRGVLFAAHPGLAASHRWPGGPHSRPLAPINAAPCGDHRMDRTGCDPVGLHPTEPDYSLSG